MKAAAVKERLAVGFKQFLRFVYDKDTRKIFGRSSLSWGMSKKAVHVLYSITVYVFHSSKTIVILLGVLPFFHGNLCRTSVGVPCCDSTTRR